MSPTLVSPPANATKKNSGKSAGARNAGLVKYLYVCLPATAHATAKKPPILGHPRPHRGRRAAYSEHDDRRRATEAEHPRQAAADVHAHQEPEAQKDDALDQPERDYAGEHPGQEGGRPHRGQGEPVEKAILDVAGEVAAGRDCPE